MKPFIKPRPARSPAASPPPPAPPPAPTPGELSILTLAAAIADDDERASYLERACQGDSALRARIAERLAAKASRAVSREDAPQAVPAIVQPRALDAGASGQAVALVPMTAAQLATAAGPQRKPATIPWFTATILAAATGALLVLFLIEREGRGVASRAADDAREAAEAARTRQIEAEAAALEARTVAERAALAGERALKERDEALAAAAADKKAREAAEQAASEAAARLQTAERAAAEAGEAAKREAAAASGRVAAANETLAATLAALAAAQMEARNHPAAVQTARQALAITADGWPAVELHAMLGAALIQTGDTAGAEREILAAAAAAEALGHPAAEPDQARLAAASKRILQFFTVTGRRREGAEWKAKLDAVAKPPAQ